MTDTDELNRIIDASGLKRQYIANACNITVQALRNKIINKSNFYAFEIKIICDLLHIPPEDRERIFYV